MRRTKLLWFALGAAASGFGTVIAMAFFTPVQPAIDTPHLELIEPIEIREDVRNEDQIANISGEIARNCGATFFETTFLSNDHLPTMEIAITPENAEAIRCIMDQADQRSIQINIIFRKATNAQTH